MGISLELYSHRKPKKLWEHKIGILLFLSFFLSIFFSACRSLSLSVYTYLLTYLLTPWSTVLLEKLTGSAASQIPRIFGTRRFITVPTSARHLSLSWANSIQSPQPPPTSWRTILILSYHLRLGLLNGLFPSGLHTKIHDVTIQETTVFLRRNLAIMWPGLNGPREWGTGTVTCDIRKALGTETPITGIWRKIQEYCQ